MLGRESIPLFNFRGIPVGLDYSWFIIFILVVVSLGGYFFPQNYPDVPVLLRWIYSLVAAFLFFSSILLHEMAHAVVAQKRGVSIKRIVLFIFGGVAQMSKEPEDAKSEFEIAAAGPLMSAVIGGVLLSAGYFLEPFIDEGLYGIIWYIGFINIILVIFNMVPGFPLDGGRILRAIIWHNTGNLRKSTRIVSNIGTGFAFFLIFMGVLWILAGIFVTGLFWIFIGIFLYQSAKSGYQMVAMREGLSQIPVTDVMTKDPQTIPPDINLLDLVEDYFFKRRYSSFPVIENERLVGMVEINDVKRIPKEKWGRTTVREVMHPWDEVKTITPDMDTFEVLMEMIDRQVGRLPVVKNGKIEGIVSRKDILSFVQLREELKG